MTPDYAGDLLILLVSFAGFLGLLLVLQGVVAGYDLLAKRRVRPVSDPRLIMPERYAGCLTCEALDGTNAVQRMVIHQRTEHAGGVRW